MSKHTQGPWRVLQGHIVETVCDEAMWVAQLGVDDRITMSETFANARLIAAAPELLAACKACAAVLGGMDTLRHIAPEFSALDLARAAIAKAEGGQE